MHRLQILIFIIRALKAPLGFNSSCIITKKNLFGINKEAFDKKIEKFNRFGITRKKRAKKIIVSLASFPQRMYDIHYCLYSLLNQSLKPDEVILWLGEEQFLNKEEDVPQNVLNLKKLGLSIKFCKDTRSYKKLIPAIKEYPDDIIVTADDDLFYDKNWLKKLYGSYLKNPKMTNCHRAHMIMFADNKIDDYRGWEKAISKKESSFLCFPTGCGGVLYPPNSLYKDILNEDLFTNLSPYADDIWFWAMAVLNNTRIKIVKKPINKLIYINLDRELNLNEETTLFQQNKNGGNDIQLANVISHYPQILSLLQNEARSI